MKKKGALPEDEQEMWEKRESRSIRSKYMLCVYEKLTMKHV
jgi:hypothetical protein